MKNAIFALSKWEETSNFDPDPRYRLNKLDDFKKKN